MNLRKDHYRETKVETMSLPSRFAPGPADSSRSDRETKEGWRQAAGSEDDSNLGVHSREPLDPPGSGMLLGAARGQIWWLCLKEGLGASRRLGPHRSRFFQNSHTRYSSRLLVVENEQELKKQFLVVDHSARASMKNAASCVN